MTEKIESLFFFVWTSVKGRMEPGGFPPHTSSKLLIQGPSNMICFLKKTTFISMFKYEVNQTNAAEFCTYFYRHSAVTIISE